MLATIFNVERVNVTLVNRQHRFFYRIHQDKQGVPMIKKFNIQHGLAGFVSVACQPVLIEFVQQDGTFV
jgi:hypothetical protein